MKLNSIVGYPGVALSRSAQPDFTSFCVLTPGRSARLKRWSLTPGGEIGDDRRQEAPRCDEIAASEAPGLQGDAPQPLQADLPEPTGRPRFKAQVKLKRRADAERIEISELTTMHEPALTLASADG